VLLLPFLDDPSRALPAEERITHGPQVEPFN
jgi:hypothetical protein